MFEKFFSKERTPEQQLKEAIQTEFDSVGINNPGIHRAFESAKKLNEENQLGYGDMFILNLIEKEALSSSGAIEDSLYGETSNTIDLITSLINDLKDKERQSWNQDR
jgi:hypothetical protein